MQTEGIDHELVRRVAGWELEEAAESSDGENVFAMVRRIGQAKAALAADYAAQLARSAGKVVFFAKHIDVMDAAPRRPSLKPAASGTPRSAATRRRRRASATSTRSSTTPRCVIVCSLTAAGVGLNLQVASNVVLAELSWTNAEQTQAIDRVHRIGQTEPVTAWRIIAAQTIDAKIAELIDSKAGLAARALDGSDEEVASADVQIEALVALLTDALTRAGRSRPTSGFGQRAPGTAQRPQRSTRSQGQSLASQPATASARGTWRSRSVGPHPGLTVTSHSSEREGYR